MEENKYIKWFCNETDTIGWHDSALRGEQQEAFLNGAVGITTNPFLVNASLRGDRAFWEERLSHLPKDLSGEEKACELTKLVACFYAEEIRPIYDRGEIGKGYVCAQVNPSKTGDVDYMMKQAKEIASWAPNIVVKIPATNAGITVYEECAALGMNVAATVSFTVPQVLAVGAAAKRGKERAVKNGIRPGLSIAVLMAGRLDDYLRDVVHDNQAQVEEGDIVQAGIACLKKAYQIFGERGYDTFLMPAGLRGTNQITELAGARMIFSLAPKIVKIIAPDQPCEERIQIPVDKDVIARLMTMKEFRKAYEEEGMTRDEFITFGSVNRTTDQFIIDGWNQLVSFQ
ncbi:MAG: hypothetical protein HFJ10_08360 [Lachnospiraceae bacterium]|nr:hypothetical protein [Lachnospiraceae bacterium]